MRFTETLTAPTIDELNVKLSAFKALPKHDVLEVTTVLDMTTGLHSVDVLYEDGRANKGDWKKEFRGDI